MSFLRLDRMAKRYGEQTVINGVSLYEDTLHFTPRGAAMIWTWLAPQVQRAGAAR